MEYIDWLGRQDSNLRMTESKSVALPLGYFPATVYILPCWTLRYTWKKEFYLYLKIKRILAIIVE